jgi:fatty acid desaturase
MTRAARHIPRESDRFQGRKLEWPTLIVAGSIYTGFAGLTWHYHALPWWVALPLGAYLVAWHGSLQHEAVHGHPTRWPWINELLAFPSLWLWMPYRVYRLSHLQHHATASVTDPIDDPESYYLTPEAWERSGPFMRLVRRINNTSAGRLLVGPAIVVTLLIISEMRRVAGGDRSMILGWLLHIVSCGIVLFWVLSICQIALIDYLLLFVYPGISVTLLRSFVEHQANHELGQRTVIVESNPIMSLLYLYNNLHALHHSAPHLPWYQLPSRYHKQRTTVLTDNGDYRYRGYAAVITRYLLRAKEPVVHP